MAPYKNTVGPKVGNRNRNTLVNNASKASPPAPPVSPQNAVQYGGQLAQLQYSLAQRLAALRAQKGLVQGQFAMDRAGAKALGISEMAAAVNNSLDRGLLNSSIDYAGRTDALAAKETAMQQALQTKLQGLLGIRTERLDAVNQYYAGLFEVQAAKAAERADLANQAFLQGLFDQAFASNQGPGKQPGTVSAAEAARNNPNTGMPDREGAGWNQQFTAALQALGPILNFLPGPVRQNILARIRQSMLGGGNPNNNTPSELSGGL